MFHKKFSSFNALCRIVDEKEIHLVAYKNRPLEASLPENCIIGRFNDDIEFCDILFTALHEVPCLHFAQLIVHTMPCGIYRLSDGSSYSNVDDISGHYTGDVPVVEVSSDLWLEISSNTPKWPTTGIIALYILAKTNAKSIHLHGFDVWAKASKDIKLYDQKYINDSHFPPGIIGAMRRLLLNDRRIVIHGCTLSEIEYSWMERLGDAYDLELDQLVCVTDFKRVDYSLATHPFNKSSSVRGSCMEKTNFLPLLRYSPLCIPGRSKLIKSISVEALKSAYQAWLGINVDSYFPGIESIALYECLHSKIRFFYPPIRPGGSDFYSALQVNDWYYVKDKWEWQKAFNLISENDKVLEVGCGNAQFLQSLSQNKLCSEIVGLETNAGCFNGDTYKDLSPIINVMRSDLKSYIERHSSRASGEKYNIVCTFQVLEHISEPLSFLSDCKKILRSDGIMIHAVPNCGGFIKYADQDWCTNYPPHHYLWWSRESISYAASLIGMEVLFYSEPISRSQAKWASDIYLNEAESRLARISVFWSRVFRRLARIAGIHKLIFLMLCLSKAEGHTLLCVFRNSHD